MLSVVYTRFGYVSLRLSPLSDPPPVTTLPVKRNVPTSTTGMPSRSTTRKYSVRDRPAGSCAGTSLSTALAQQADVYAFLFQQLGVEYRPVTK